MLASSGASVQHGYMPRAVCAGEGDAWPGKASRRAAKCCLTSSPAWDVQFLQFRMKIMNKQLDRFGNRVEFTGNPTKYDVSFTLKNVQLEDEGTYNCYVLNPPDRHRGHASISLKVLTKGKRWSGPLCCQAPMGASWLSGPPRALPSPCIAHAGLAPRRGGASPGASLLLLLAAPGGGCVP